MRNLTRAQNILLQHTKRSPSRCINSTAYHVIKDVVEAGGGFPVVSQSTIDTDMEVTVEPKIGVHGKPLKGKTEISIPNFSLATLIVMARMNPASKYSLLTGNRWPVRKRKISDFARAYGHENAVEMFMEAIRPIADRMIRARHSSTGYLKLSWIDLKKLLAPFAMGKSNMSTGVTVGDYSDVKPAKEGSVLAICTVSNTLGVEPGASQTTKELAEKYNEANIRIGVPRLQAAINREFEGKMRVADRNGWTEDVAALEACGMMTRLV